METMATTMWMDGQLSVYILQIEQFEGYVQELKPQKLESESWHRRTVKAYVHCELGTY